MFVPLGDDVADFTHHRGPTHSLLLHAAATPVIAWAMGRVQPAILPFRLRRWLLAFLCLTTHALLDGFTAYSTQLLWPLPGGADRLVDPCSSSIRSSPCRCSPG